MKKSSKKHWNYELSILISGFAAVTLAFVFFSFSTGTNQSENDFNVKIIKALDFLFLTSLISSFLIGLKKDINWSLLKFLLIIGVPLIYLSIIYIKPDFLTVIVITFIYLLFSSALFNYPCHIITKSTKNNTVAKDLLYRNKLYSQTYQSIKKLLNNDEINQCVAIYGEWGSGKTHLLNHIVSSLKSDFNCELKEESKQIDICEVSLWESRNLTDAKKNIAKALQDLFLQKCNKNIIAEATILISDIACTINPFFIFIKKIINNIVINCRNVTDEEIESLNEALGNRKCVLIFEDLDRCDYNIIAQLLPLLDQLKKINNLLIICSIAQEELDLLFKKEGYDSDILHGYLAKIFDWSIYIPPPSDQVLMDMAFAISEEKYADCVLLQSFLKEMQSQHGSFQTPRQIERMLAKWSSIERQYFYLPKGQQSVNSLEEEFIQRVHIVFAIEGLRMYIPSYLQDFPHILRNWCEDFDIGKRHIGVEPQNKWQHRLIKKKFETTMKNIIFNIFQERDSHDTFDIYYAINIDYAKQKYLNCIDCEFLVDKFRSSNLTISELLQAENIESHYLLGAKKSLLRYAINRMHYKHNHLYFTLKTLETLPTPSIPTWREHLPFSQRSIVDLTTFHTVFSLLCKNHDDLFWAAKIMYQKLDFSDSALVIANNEQLDNDDLLFYPSEHNVRYPIIAPFRVYAHEYSTFLRPFIQLYINRLCLHLSNNISKQVTHVGAKVIYYPFDAAPNEQNELLEDFKNAISSWLNKNETKAADLLIGLMTILKEPLYDSPSAKKARISTTAKLIEAYRPCFELHKQFDNFSTVQLDEIFRTTLTTYDVLNRKFKTHSQTTANLQNQEGLTTILRAIMKIQEEALLTLKKRKGDV